MAISALSVKITLPLIGIAAMGIGLTAFLNLGKFEQTFLQLESSRIGFIVHDMRANLDTGLALGLPLKSLENAQEVIDFARRKDPAILSIHIRDDAGAVIFHTGQTLSQPLATPTSAEHEHAHAGGEWHAIESDALVVGTHLSGILGAPAGELDLRYSRVAHDAAVNAVAKMLTLAAIGGIAVTALIALFGVHFFLARISQSLLRIEQTLHAVSLDQTVSRKNTHPSNTPPLTLTDTLVQTAEAVMSDIRQAQHCANEMIASSAQKPSP
jgi:hypothetical protein